MRAFRFRFLVGVCTALLASLTTASAQTPAPATHLTTLTRARVSTLAEGRIVVSMDAEGDLPGSMTVTLSPDGAGGYTGQWAHVVAFLEDLNADGTSAPLEHAPGVHEMLLHEPVLHEQHREYTRPVRRGTLSGAVVAATLRTDVNGHVTGVNFAELTVAAGSLTFRGVAGTGFLATVVTDGVVAGNSLSLSF
jgi:hypothetical protein